MRPTGIVRRIDELGRVVIPKEIRQNLRIREGGPLEIYVDRHENCLCLKKYSPISDLATFLRGYSDAASRTLGIPVLITDRDQIIDAAGCFRNFVLDEPISCELERLIEFHESLISNEEGKNIPLTVNNSNLPDYKAQIIFPIIANEEVMGTIILLPDSVAKESQIKVAETMARMIGQQLEE